MQGWQADEAGRDTCEPQAACRDLQLQEVRALYPQTLLYRQTTVRAPLLLLSITSNVVFYYHPVHSLDTCDHRGLASTTGSYISGPVSSYHCRS